MPFVNPLTVIGNVEKYNKIILHPPKCEDYDGILKKYKIGY